MIFRREGGRRERRRCNEGGVINERNQSNVRNPLYKKMTKDMNANPTVSGPIPSSSIGKRGGEGDKVFKPESTVPPRKKRHKKSIKKYT